MQVSTEFLKLDLFDLKRVLDGDKVVAAYDQHRSEVLTSRKVVHVDDFHDPAILVYWEEKAGFTAYKVNDDLRYSLRMVPKPPKRVSFHVNVYPNGYYGNEESKVGGYTFHSKQDAVSGKVDRNVPFAPVEITLELKPNGLWKVVPETNE